MYSEIMSLLSRRSVQNVSALIGDKWTPQLICCLLDKKALRFCQLQEQLDGINPRTLSARLTKLEQSGLITKTTCDNSQRCEYALSPKGQTLLPIIESMSRWS